MTTTAIHYKPFNDVIIIDIKTFFKAINYIYWLQRLPMALLSIPAAYGVAAFAHVHLPAPFNVLAGAGFESVYLGAIALADQMFDSDDFTTILWWVLNGLAVIMSALINVLFSSNNTFSAITVESLVHGIPLPVLSFGYSLLLHNITNKNLARDYAKQKKLEEDLEKVRKFEADNPFVCGVCGERKPTRIALSNHSRIHKKSINQ